jgi:hypothetical protein
MSSPLDQVTTLERWQGHLMQMQKDSSLARASALLNLYLGILEGDGSATGYPVRSHHLSG